MKNYRLFGLAGLLAIFTVLTAAAQTRPTTAPLTGGATQGIAVPESRIAFVNTDAFQDPKDGIARYVAAVSLLDKEFQPRQQELTTLQTQINTLADDINKLSGSSVVDPKTIQTKQELGEKLQRDFKYKKDMYDADVQRRYREAVGPVSEDIGKALDAFAKAHGITMILDISKMAPAVLSVNDSMNVTRQFIIEYNSKYPATASVSTPGRP
jgi:Skp family chaperone for outer membrane proteins